MNAANPVLEAKPDSLRSLPQSLRSWIERRGALVAALVAVCASLPGLSFPFLAEDWVLLGAIAKGTVPIAPFGYFRPLYSATIWLDRELWGASPFFFHLTNLLLIASASALLVQLVMRYTADARIACATGVLFALHPYHVENAAWVAVRGDPLFSVFCLLSALAYDRWRSRAKGLPFAAIGLFEAALLSKETAIFLPAMLLLVGLVDRSRRPAVREIGRGLVPLALVGGAHLFLLRRIVLGPGARPLMTVVWGDALKRGAGYCVAALVPVDVELLAARPILWGSAAAAAAAALLVLARARSGRIPRVVFASAAAFLLLAAPGLIGFQERFLFLAAGASGLGLASLLRALRGRLAGAAGAAVCLAWSAGVIAQWGCWRQAAVASRQLIDDLVVASRREAITEIVVANMPFRVRGGAVYVYGDFLGALAVAGGRPVPVRAASYLTYARADADGLERPPVAVPAGSSQPAEVRLRIPSGPFSHWCSRAPPPGGGLIDEGAWSLLFDGRGGVRIEIRQAAGGSRAAYAWVGGRLTMLF